MKVEIDTWWNVNYRLRVLSVAWHDDSTHYSLFKFENLVVSQAVEKVISEKTRVARPVPGT